MDEMDVVWPIKILTEKNMKVGINEFIKRP